ncbi:MAG: hypothetical protein RI897_619 [Verrucomicrobiota bacterium]|jgi:hypothetical protein
MKRRPRASQQTPEGEETRGSLAMVSMRKSGGKWKAAADSAGVSGLGASVGRGISARARSGSSSREIIWTRAGCDAAGELIEANCRG